MLLPPSVAQNLLKLPGRSGMVTASTASRCSPSSASSAMKRKRSKLVLAPEAIATRVLFLEAFFSTQALAPATASAPAGSVSYTHLRAHETPEHLVCRLLLEKK